MPQYAKRNLIVVAAPLLVVLVAAGVALLVTGVRFALWPASLAEAGFMRDPGAWRRLGGLLVFGGTGAMFLLMAYGLLRSWPFFWRRFAHAATAIALTAMGIIWREPNHRWVAWIALAAAVSSLVLFLRIRHDLPGDMRPDAPHDTAG